MTTEAFALSDEQQQEIVALLIDFFKERLTLGRVTSYTEIKGHLITCDETRRAKGKPEILSAGRVNLFSEALGYMGKWLREVDRRIAATNGIEDVTVICWKLDADRPGDGYFADRQLDYSEDAKVVYAAQHVARVFAAWKHR